MAGRYGTIPSNLSIGASQSIRRNAADNGFEVFTPFVLPTDPNADKILFWDDSAGSAEWLTLGTGLSITGTTINAATGLTVGTTPIASGGANRVLFHSASGDYVNESANLTFDGTRLGIGNASISSSQATTLMLGPSVGGSYTGQNNLFAGIGAGGNNANNALEGNTYVGRDAGALTSVDANFNTFIGWNAGKNTTGRDNVFIGANVGTSNTSGAGNNFVGSGAGAFCTTGAYNNFFGRNAGRAVTTANFLSFFGESAGQSVTTGSANVAFGNSALNSVTTGDSNTALGNEAGANFTGGRACIFIGDGAGKGSSGNYNQVIGALAAGGAMSGRGNIILGYRSAYSITSGALNVIIGTNEGGSAITTGSQNVFLGNGAGMQETGSNKLYIAHTDTTTPLIYGDFGALLLHWNATKVRQKYDGSNYVDFDVSNTGVWTGTAVGSGAKFVFSNAVEVAYDSTHYGSHTVNSSSEYTIEAVGPSTTGEVKLKAGSNYIAVNASGAADTATIQAPYISIGASGLSQIIIGDSSSDMLLESNVIQMNNLPTSDPGVPGQLWNDGGKLMISI